MEIPTIRERYTKFEKRFPFAVIGADKEYAVEGRRVLGRAHPWGLIDIENELGTGH